MNVMVGDTVIAGNDWNSSSPEYGVVRAQGHNFGLHHSGWMDAAGTLVNEYGDESAPLGTAPDFMSAGYILPSACA